MKMHSYEQDPDVVRWGLHHLMEVCSVTNGGPPGVFTHYDKDLSSSEYVSEGYFDSNYTNVQNYNQISNQSNIENDEMLARALQEELARLAEQDNHESLDQKESILAQNWVSPSKRHEVESNQEQERENDERSVDDEDESCSPEMADESVLDGEVGKRINQMFPIRHVPKVNGEMPSADEATSDDVTLQAAADAFGVKIFVLTSFKDTCYIEILPFAQKSKRIVFLSFWAEVHYNSIYPEGELPSMESKKKKKWWMLGS